MKKDPTYYCVFLSKIPFIGILAYPIVFFLSMFAFDAPGSQSDPAVLFIVFLLLSYPVSAFYGYSITSKAHEEGDIFLALIGVLVSYANLLILILLIGVA